jgi:hypothetical protein
LVRHRNLPDAILSGEDSSRTLFGEVLKPNFLQWYSLRY